MRTLHGTFSSRIRLVVILVILVGILFLIGTVSGSPQYTLQPGTPDLKAASAQFVSDIREFGGKKAYERLAVAIQSLDIDDQHGYAHEFGSELYKIEGESGITVCDVRFSMGCFHQFLGNAIEDLGTSSVRRLFEACGGVAGTSEVCEHGLGHGLLSGLGYSEQNLRDALALCDDVTHNKQYAGCNGGAFMEYNLRTIASAEGTMGVRELEGDTIYAPCDSLDQSNSKTCTFWLPEWWYFGVLRGTRTANSNDEAYETMGRWCAQSQEPQACYEGIGYITPSAFDFRLAEVRAACDRVGEAGGGNVYCRSMAGLIFHITVGQMQYARELCDGLSDAERNVCMQYASYTGNNFSFSVPVPPESR